MLELNTVYNLLARTDAAYEMPELMSRAFIPVIVALIVFYVGLKLQFNGKPAWIKWLAVLPLFIGIFVSIDPFQSYFLDPLYKEVYPNLGGKRMMMLHAAGIVVPVLGAGLMAIWAWWMGRQKLDDL